MRLRCKCWARVNLSQSKVSVLGDLVNLLSRTPSVTQGLGLLNRLSSKLCVWQIVFTLLVFSRCLTWQWLVSMLGSRLMSVCAGVSVGLVRRGIFPRGPVNVKHARPPVLLLSISKLLTGGTSLATHGLLW